MSAFTLYRFPLDPTGVNTSNRVVDEPHTLVNRVIRAFAPSYGAYYTESLVIRDVASGLTLTPSQYKTVEMYEVPTGRYGKEICGVIMIIDAAVSNNVQITYQALGGEYSNNSDAIISMINSLDLDNRPVNWPDLIGKPQGFEPAAHYHDIGDVYGFEYVVHAVERLRTAILAGDGASHDELRRYIDDWAALLTGGGNSNLTELRAHTSNVSNPHATTKSQVGLGSVENYAIATTAEAQAGIASNKYMTPALTAAAITKIAGDALTVHTSRVDNPHATTKAQVGLGSVQNLDLATTAEAQAGSSNAKYMTPALTAAAINKIAGDALAIHTARVDNPHSTTKSQVGLGNVQNYTMATTADAQTGTSTTTYATPKNINEALVYARDNGMFDTRYVQPGTAVNTSLRVNGANLEGYINGAWKIVWPPQWQ